ncbi:MAG: FecR domain-containing protein [Deltaproteobacteria bacterium]|nr:FecR domain-containing protein [Deltaproteobacteria bacterium]
MQRKIISFSVLFVFSFAPLAWSEVVYFGKITAVAGKVESQRKDAAAAAPANVGDMVFEGGSVKTHAASRAGITLRDNSRVFIGPNSKVRLGKFTLDDAEETRDAEVDVSYGKLRVITAKIMKATAAGERRPWRNLNFTVETPTAVAVIKGSDCVFNVTPDNTDIGCFDGMAIVKNKDPKVEGEEIIGSDEDGSVPKDKPPSGPSGMTPDEKDALDDGVEDGEGEGEGEGEVFPYEPTDATAPLPAGGGGGGGLPVSGGGGTGCASPPCH